MIIPFFERGWRLPFDYAHLFFVSSFSYKRDGLTRRGLYTSDSVFQDKRNGGKTQEIARIKPPENIFFKDKSSLLESDAAKQNFDYGSFQSMSIPFFISNST